MVVLLDTGRWLSTTAKHLTVAGLDACLDADVLTHGRSPRCGAVASCHCPSSDRHRPLLLS